MSHTIIRRLLSRARPMTATSARTVARAGALALLASLVAAADAWAHEGWGIVVDRHGRVHVADIPRNTVWRYSREGGAEPVLRHIHSHALVLGSDGAVHGTHVPANGSPRSAWRLDATGRLTTVLAGADAAALGLQSFLVGADGTIYSGSPFQHPEPPGGRTLHLVRRTPAGVVDTVAGGTIGHADGRGHAARFESIDGLAWLPDGSLVVADGVRLRRVTSSGDVTTLPSPPTTRRWGEDLLGVAVGPEGRVLVADFAGRTVWRMDASGPTRVDGPGRFWAPTGVAVAGEALYVLEHPRAPFGILGDLGIGPYLRVRRRDADGRWTVLATGWGDWTRPVGIGTGLVVLGLAALGVRGRRRHGPAGPARQAVITWSGSFASTPWRGADGPMGLAPDRRRPEAEQGSRTHDGGAGMGWRLTRPGEGRTVPGDHGALVGTS